MSDSTSPDPDRSSLLLSPSGLPLETIATDASLQSPSQTDGANGLDVREERLDQHVDTQRLDAQQTELARALVDFRTAMLAENERLEGEVERLQDRLRRALWFGGGAIAVAAIAIFASLTGSSQRLRVLSQSVGIEAGDRAEQIAAAAEEIEAELPAAIDERVQPQVERIDALEAELAELQEVERQRRMAIASLTQALQILSTGAAVPTVPAGEPSAAPSEEMIDDEAPQDAENEEDSKTNTAGESGNADDANDDTDREEREPAPSLDADEREDIDGLDP